MFTLLSLALLLVSRTVPGLSTIQHEPDENLAAHQLASALLVPFLVLLGSGLLTSTVFGEIRSADAIVVVATAAALWRYRAAYRTLTWSWTWWSVAIGVGVFAIWMTLVRADPGDGHQAAVSLEMSDGLAVGWIVLRLIRSVLIVPVVEELAFRGYLLRKLASAHFDRVPMGEFTWLSLFASTILFGLLHQHWLAGTIAGFAYAIAQRQCRSIGGAVIAHGVTNGLIAAVMVVDGQWGLRP